MLANFLVLNSKGPRGKENESCCLVFPFSTKQEIRHFHVVVVQRWLRNVQKGVIHMQSYCFANLNLILFLPFSLPSLSSLLKLPIVRQEFIVCWPFMVFLFDTVIILIPQILLTAFRDCNHRHLRFLNCQRFVYTICCFYENTHNSNKHCKSTFTQRMEIKIKKLQHTKCLSLSFIHLIAFHTLITRILIKIYSVHFYKFLFHFCNYLKSQQIFK